MLVDLLEFTVRFGGACPTNRARTGQRMLQLFIGISRTKPGVTDKNMLIRLFYCWFH
jgi:hypothetical protein